jgi:hypothetical protein
MPNGQTLTDSQRRITEEVNDILELLLEKNRKYGDSALNPTRIFSRADALEQINVRIDDKLKRIQNRQGDEDEDVDRDLIGYLVLRRVARRLHADGIGTPERSDYNLPADDTGATRP